jgi:16S rRNA (uracil1498-N3)-methyltransferase
MELIIQKTVELGVHAIIPTEMNRCVVKLDGKKKESKVARWQAISESAAKQSKRNIIPEIHPVMTFSQALKMASELDLILVPYENKERMKATAQALSQIKSGSNVGIFIGPEGGFEEKEILEAEKNGGEIVSLGKRILRTETAAITALSMCMLYAEMNIEVAE